uniref:Uncharacterized protein n=1 Tax=Lessoniopsis littoralis TaxID=169788 RepID=A0A8F0JYH1_9PHAE|nr:hypothetical protein [Lessoniopsis littoralis]
MINKNRKTLQILFLIKDLDPIFFEFVKDSIEYPDKKLTFTKKESLKVCSININIILFFIYCNIFSTKRLNAQLQQKPTGDKAKGNLFYLINKNKGKQKGIGKALNKDKDLKQQFQKNFFLSINQKKNNEIISSQILTSIGLLEDFNLI